jgi:hypothetical protein
MYKGKTMRFIIRISLITILAAFSCGCTNRDTDEPDETETWDWDLVYISDSTGWGAANRYAKNIEENTGKTVRVKDYAIGGLPAIQVLDLI